MSQRETPHRRNSRVRSPYTRRLRVEALEDRRMLAILTVQNNLDDTLANLAGDEELSLREAIEIANNPGTVIDGFMSNDVEDTIEFVEDLSNGPADLAAPRITLSGTELVLSETVTIDATNLPEGLTIDANEQSRVLNIVANTGDFSLSGLIITGGRTTENNSGDSNSGVVFHDHSGGGIRSLTSGNVHVFQSTIDNNGTLGRGAGGGGIFTDVGTLILDHSTVINNVTSNAAGGGIFAQGNVQIIQTTIYGNESGAGSGGGIFSSGALSLVQSTVSGNRTEGLFGGGGILAQGPSLSIVGTTIVDNHATHQFFPNTGGGVSALGPISLEIEHSLVARNTGRLRNANDLYAGSASSLVVNYTLIGDTTGTNIEATTGTGNLLDVDPLLGPLAYNGGPTQTHALLTGSPAIDTGDPTIAMPPANDQRGAPFLRIADGNGDGTAAIDMGAFEVPDTLIVDTQQDVVDPLDGFTSLREAIGETNLSAEPNNIIFDDGLSGETILLDGAELSITDSLSIDATSLSEKVTIDANLQSRVINIDAETGDYSLSGLVITGGQTVEHSPWIFRTRGSGGGIRSITSGSLMVYESVVENNSTLGSGSSGGGLYVHKGKFTLYRSTVRGNSSEEGSGGGLAAVGNFISSGFNSVIAGESVIEQSTISNNHASEVGGGIYLAGKVSKIISSTISSNHAGGMFGGGGIHSAARSLSIDQSTINANHATFPHAFASGGGLRSGSNVAVSRSIIAGNTAAVGGNDLDSSPAMSYSLVGDTTGSGIDANTGVGNLLDVDPLLGPLADNGGPTQTHALLPGSPAIDAGDPTVPFDLNVFDQRGQPFLRVADGNLPNDIAIDIGAYEAQSVSSADFDADGDVDGADFLTWQRGFGMENAVRADGNSDDDTDVDASDLAAWSLTYGEGAAPVASSQGVEASDGAISAAWALLVDTVDEGELTLESTGVEAVSTTLDASVRPLAAFVRRNAYRELERVTEADDHLEPWLSEELLDQLFGES